MWRECSINAEEKLGYHRCQARNKGMINGVNSYPSSVQFCASLRYLPEFPFEELCLEPKNDKGRQHLPRVRAPGWQYYGTFLGTRDRQCVMLQLQRPSLAVSAAQCCEPKLMPWFSVNLSFVLFFCHLKGSKAPCNEAASAKRWEAVGSTCSCYAKDWLKVFSPSGAV